jgi:hypothetical protein
MLLFEALRDSNKSFRSTNYWPPKNSGYSGGQLDSTDFASLKQLGGQLHDGIRERLADAACETLHGQNATQADQNDEQAVFH